MSGIKISKAEVSKLLEKSDYKNKELPETTIDQIIDDFKNNKIYFNKIKYYKFGNRRLATFEDSLNELTFVDFVSNKIKKMFEITFPNRNSIMRGVFSSIKFLKDLNDFTIIRFDFKKYFSSISTEYIYEQYLKEALLKREIKDKILEYSKTIPYCVPGLSLSNTFAELIAKDFDVELRRLLSQYGIAFYERYIDDGFIILNKFLDKSDAIKILKKCIKAVYFRESTQNKTLPNRTELNLNSLKFQIINRRNLSDSNLYSFNFLGYKFEFDYKLNFSYGISENKIAKFSNKIEKLVLQYHNNPIYMRHILKANSSRIIYYSSVSEKSRFWVQKGIISSYNELKGYEDKLTTETETFLKNIYANIFKKLGISIPNYINSARYNLYNNLSKNKTMIFDEKIGISRAQLIKELNSVGIIAVTNATYYSLVRNYLIKIKVGH